MKVTTTIIDDEPLAAQLLESYVRKTPYLELTGVYNSAVHAMKFLREKPVQLLLLDIQMPELSGIEFARIVPKDTKIIFTTAFSQYAIEGFKVSAIDYLMKPIAYNDFIKATDKVMKWYESQMKQESYRNDRFMFVKSDYKLIRILLAEGLRALLSKVGRENHVADEHEKTGGIPASPRVPAHAPLLHCTHAGG